jgi:fructosamine-3-kinase
MRAETDWRAIAESVHAAGGPRLDTGRVREVGGGCIHDTWRVASPDAGSVFVKLNDASHADNLACEADGLAALARAGAVRVPAVLAQGVAGRTAYLVLEWIDLHAPDAAARAALGAGLAALHRTLGPRHGWERNNYIGLTPQPNGWSDDWIAFVRDRRIGHQLDLAERRGHAALAQAARPLLERIGRLFEGYRPAPSLLHGDLWGGNWLADGDGNPVLFDPAVHYGDRESDLAMTELFGGFGAPFYEAYAAAWPLASGYPARRDLYQLYHVLNHLNLFGGGYAATARRLVDRLLEATSR